MINNTGFSGRGAQQNASGGSFMSNRSDGSTVRPKDGNPSVTGVQEPVKAAAAMDRTTALIVSELSSQLLPPLQDAISTINVAPAVRDEVTKLASVLREMVDAETEDRRMLLQPVASAVDEISSLSVVCANAAKFMDHEKAQQMLAAVEEIKSSFGRLSTALDAANENSAELRRSLAEAMEGMKAGISVDVSRGIGALEKSNAEALNAVQAPLKSVSDGIGILKSMLLDMEQRQQGRGDDGLLSKLPEMEAALSALRESVSKSALAEAKGRASLMEAVASIGSGISDMMEAYSKRGADKAAKDDEESDTSLLKTLEQALPSWEGILRAHSQSQTRELEALSREMSQLQKQSEEAMLRRIKEAVHEEAVRNAAEWTEHMNTQYDRYEQRQKLLMKLLAATAAMSGVALMVSLAALMHM